MDQLPNSNPRNNNFLLVSKTGFLDDFKVISLHEKNNLNFFVLNRIVVDVIAKGFLPLSQQVDYLPNELYCSRPHEDLQIFWTKLFHRLNFSYNFKGLVSGSWVYWNERDLHEALVTLKIPVVVLYKEAVASKVASDYLIAKYNLSRPFTGDLLLVYSEEQRKRLIAGKISTEEKVCVVGSPRFDVLHREKSFSILKQMENPQFKVVFFLHDDFIGASDVNFPPYFSYLFTRAREDLLDLAIQLAWDNPKIIVFVKTKVTTATINLVKKREDELAFLPNLRFAYGGIASEALSKASVTVAFNSTSTLDSVAAGVETILYRPIYSQGYVDLLIDFGQDLESCFTKHDLLQSLTIKFLKFPDYFYYDENFRFCLLDKFVGNGDGKASERVLFKLTKLIL